MRLRMNLKRYKRGCSKSAQPARWAALSQEPVALQLLHKYKQAKHARNEAYRRRDKARVQLKRQKESFDDPKLYVVASDRT